MDTMGRASAEAQSLHSIITSAEKLRTSDNKLYMFCDFVSNRVVGLLKIGKKKLFLFDDAGTQHELNSALCILDFYIHETRQRQVQTGSSGDGGDGVDNDRDKVTPFFGLVLFFGTKKYTFWRLYHNVEMPNQGFFVLFYREPGNTCLITCYARKAFQFSILRLIVLLTSWYSFSESSTDSPRCCHRSIILSCLMDSLPTDQVWTPY